MRYYAHADRAGCVSLQRSRRTGTMVGVYHAEQARLCPEGGAWVTVCEAHGTLCNHETLRLARLHAPTVDWCDDCREALEAREEQERRITPAQWRNAVAALDRFADDMNAQAARRREEEGE